MPTSSENPTSVNPSTRDGAWVNLADYRAPGFAGRGKFARIVWYFVSLLLFESGWFLLTRAKPAILRWFGAKLGRDVVIKPHVRIKFPWRLTAGDHVWIGEGTWIDNLAEVQLGSQVCVSQGTYFCTGSHDYKSVGFELLTAPIRVESGAWVAARSTLMGGVTVRANALVAAGSVVTKDVAAGMIVGGNPAKEIKPREQPGS